MFYAGVSVPCKAGLYYRDVGADFPGADGFWMEASKFHDGPDADGRVLFDLASPCLSLRVKAEQAEQAASGGEGEEGCHWEASHPPSSPTRRGAGGSEPPDDGSVDSFGQPPSPRMLPPSSPDSTPRSLRSGGTLRGLMRGKAGPLRFGGLMLNVSYTMRDVSTGTRTHIAWEAGSHVCAYGGRARSLASIISA